jgi:hypothetical protein
MKVGSEGARSLIIQINRLGTSAASRPTPGLLQQVHVDENHVLRHGFILGQRAIRLVRAPFVLLEAFCHFGTVWCTVCYSIQGHVPMSVFNARWVVLLVSFAP